MLDEATRTAILKLKAAGHGTRAIAKALAVARVSVRRVIASGAAAAPPLMRPEFAEAHREAILELYARYQGHLGRVHEELLARGADLSYPTLTAFCRKHGIGAPPPPPAGHYDFPAGQEMQHDTSPHAAMIAGRLMSVQTASLVLCYSRNAPRIQKRSIALRAAYCSYFDGSTLCITVCRLRAASSLSVALNRPVRRCGGTTDSSVSSFMDGSTRV